MLGCEIDLFGSVGRPGAGDCKQGNETCGFDTTQSILWPQGGLLASEKEVCSMALVLYDQDKIFFSWYPSVSPRVATDWNEACLWILASYDTEYIWWHLICF